MRTKGTKLLKRSELDSQHPLEYMGAHRGFWGKYVRATRLLILPSTVPSGCSSVMLLPSSFLLYGSLRLCISRHNPLTCKGFLAGAVLL